MLRRLLLIVERRNVPCFHAGQSLIIPGHVMELFDKLGSTKKFDEVLVVRDDDELESARATRMDDIGQSLGQTLDVLAIEIGSGFVERENSAILAESLGEGQTNDQRG